MHAVSAPPLDMREVEMDERSDGDVDERCLREIFEEFVRMRR